MTWMAVAVAAALVGAACSSAPEEAQLAGYRIAPEPEVGEVSLTDVTTGDDFAFRARDGELLLVYFGFTHCPDVCPTTLADVRIALDDLGEAAERVRLAMVTVDPARDTADLLIGYVQSFVEGAHALRTDVDAELREVASAFGVFYVVETDDEGEIEVGHTATLFGVDAEGRVIVSWLFGTTPDDLASDMGLLLAELAP